jgi:hypothetical protein
MPEVIKPLIPSSHAFLYSLARKSAIIPTVVCAGCAVTYFLPEYDIVKTLDYFLYAESVFSFFSIDLTNTENFINLSAYLSFTAEGFSLYSWELIKDYAIFDDAQMSVIPLGMILAIEVAMNYI